MSHRKFKLKKNIKILSHKFNLVWSKDIEGGYFSFSSMKMGISTKYLKKNPEYVWNILVHEISEACHCALKIRYDDPSCHDNYKFFMDHKEFEAHSELLSTVLYKFLK